MSEDRRGFIGAALAGVAGVALGCEEGPPPDPPPLPDDRILPSALAAGPVDFTYPTPRHAAFALKLGRPVEGGVGPDGDVVAFHRACPHMGCPLTRVDHAKATLGPCACHRSLFDLSRGGAQIYGRATQGLVKVLLEEQADGSFCAVGIEGLPYGEPLREPEA